MTIQFAVWNHISGIPKHTQIQIMHSRTTSCMRREYVFFNAQQTLYGDIAR